MASAIPQQQALRLIHGSLHCSQCNLVIGKDITTEHWRIEIIGLRIGDELFRVVVCVAVEAAMPARAVGADVDAFHATAFLALALVLADLASTAANAFNSLRIDATGVTNAELR